jgi:hypothetical protein
MLTLTAPIRPTQTVTDLQQPADQPVAPVPSGLSAEWLHVIDANGRRRLVIKWVSNPARSGALPTDDRSRAQGKA